MFTISLIMGTKFVMHIAFPFVVPFCCSLLSFPFVVSFCCSLCCSLLLFPFVVPFCRSLLLFPFVVPFCRSLLLFPFVVPFVVPQRGTGRIIIMLEITLIIGTIICYAHAFPFVVPFYCSLCGSFFCLF